MSMVTPEGALEEPQAGEVRGGSAPCVCAKLVLDSCIAFSSLVAPCFFSYGWGGENMDISERNCVIFPCE